MRPLSTHRVPELPRISVVVPCLNEREYIDELLDDLQRQDTPPDEIVVVDGGSHDGTMDVLRRRQRASPVIPIHILEQPGASIPQELNIGIAAATGNVIVRIDAHSRPARHYIAAALPHLVRGDVGVVGGLWQIAPGARTAVAQAIAKSVSHPLGAGDATYRTARSLTEPVDVDTVPFGCFRKDVWSALGGFDESLHSNEDYEFNYRVRRSGLRVVLDPTIHSRYYARPTLRALARQYFRYGWWKAQMLRRSPESLRWRQAVPAACAAGVFLLLGAGLVVPAAWAVLGVLLGIYAALLAGVSARICAAEGGWTRWLPLCCAFSVVHSCWGTGVLVNIVSRAKWPRPAVRVTTTASPHSVT